MRDLLTLPMHRRQRRRQVGQAFFERPDEKRQRRPEFVADVAEEHRLGAIELGEPFRALPFLLVRAGVADSCAELIGHEIQEGLVQVVERTPRIETDHQPTRTRVRIRRGDDELLDQLRPEPGQLLLRAWRGALQVVAEVDEGERDVLRPVSQGVRGKHAGVAGRARGRILLGETAQQRHAAPADDALGGFGDDAVNTANLARLDANGIVRHVEIRFFRKSVPLEFEQQILPPERLAGPDDARQQFVKDAVPDFAPGFAAGKSQGVGVFGAKDRAVGVVVEDGELGAPEQDDLRL